MTFTLTCRFWYFYFIHSAINREERGKDTQESVPYRHALGMGSLVALDVIVIVVLYERKVKLLFQILTKNKKKCSFAGVAGC